MVKITETVLRDGHQSLIATRMATSDMLPILDKLDQAGFFSLEMWGGATFDVCLRYLNEDPWERLREIRKRIKKTKLQMLLRGQNIVAYQHFPDDIVVKFIQKARDNGIDIFRIFDAVNDIRNVSVAIKTAKKTGATVEGTISYTVSPVHTIEKYIKFALELKGEGSDIICIKDMSGIITPIAAYDLVNALKKEVKLPVHLHTHCSSGMAPITYLTAAEAGVDILDTAISPFGWGTSQPPTESIVGAFRGTPYDTNINVALLAEIAEYFQKVKDKYKHILDPISERVDPRILVHQIPGGMISNLISQLKEQKAMDKYAEVLVETARVRKELGYPPLVTPTSQIVGTQAVFNIVLGERYKVVSNEVKNYIKGLYGRSPGPIDEEIRKKAIGDEPTLQGRPADNLAPAWDKTVAEVKAIKNTEAVTDEDVLSYAIFPHVANEFWNRQKQGITGPIAERERSPESGAEVAPKRHGAGGAHIGEAVPPPPQASALAGELKLKKGARTGDVTLELDNKTHHVSITPLDRCASTNGGAAADDTTPLLVEFNGKGYKVNVIGKVAGAALVMVKPEPAKPVITQPVEPQRAVTTESRPNREHPAIPLKRDGVDPAKPVSKAPETVGPVIDVKIPMPGKIVNIKVKPGDKVKKNQMLFILEAMKMQNEIDSPCEGIVNAINIKTGDNVDSNLSAMTINPG